MNIKPVIVIEKGDPTGEETTVIQTVLSARKKNLSQWTLAARLEESTHHSWRSPVSPWQDSERLIRSWPD